jgi:hypothetical protein
VIQTILLGSTALPSVWLAIKALLMLAIMFSWLMTVSAKAQITTFIS